MTKGWTSLPLRNATAEIFRKMSKDSGLTQDEYLKRLMSGRTEADSTKSYVYSSEEYNAMERISKLLYESGNISSPDTDSATKLAIMNLIEGVSKISGNIQTGQ